MKIKRKLEFGVLLCFVALGSLYGCNDNNNDLPDPKPKPPEEVYDIDLSKETMRDPFVFLDKETKTYYLPFNAGNKIQMYKSKNLKKWKDLGIAFSPKGDFWGKNDFWAPDMFEYKGKYYLFATFSNSTTKRGTSILIADKPEGPYAPLVNKATTPPDWTCLDGTLYIDDNDDPWILYSREWIEVTDGQIIAQRLTGDLKELQGNPEILFTASEGPWVGEITSGVYTGSVTDAPFIYKLPSGKLLMLWSSFTKQGKYAFSSATSENGSITGPWIQRARPYNDDDGGHAMLFNDIDGRLHLSYHAPNSHPSRPVIKEVYINNDDLIIP